ncbi:MAG TPA: Fic family protein [Egibacteraceae bacterium]|nr:Fic family protein [Egibacteraceae bacterium]
MRGHFVSLTWEHDPTLYAPARYRRACKYDAFVPLPLAGADLNCDAQLTGLLSDAERALQHLGSGGESLAPLARLLLRTESIASSKVEGLHVDVRELARGEARADTTGKVSPTTLEVLANIDAMELAIHEATATRRFTPEQIVSIHRLLMAGAPNAHVAGRVRTGQNWIGGNDYNPCGADFVPPPPEHVAPLLDDLCEAINDESLAPLAQAALVHAQFETIHPFDDGNGRTGRALIHVVLRRRGLTPSFVPPISVEFARARDRYISGLTAYRRGDVAAWLEHFVGAAARAAHLADAYLGAVASLREEWRTRLAGGPSPRSDAAAWAVIDVLPAHPVITAAVACAATGRAKAAVHMALDQLAEADVLVPLSGGRRNRSWEAAGLLDLIAELEAGQNPGRAVRG